MGGVGCCNRSTLLGDRNMISRPLLIEAIRMSSTNNVVNLSAVRGAVESVKYSTARKKKSLFVQLFREVYESMFEGAYDFRPKRWASKNGAREYIPSDSTRLGGAYDKLLEALDIGALDSGTIRRYIIFAFVVWQKKSGKEGALVGHVCSSKIVRAFAGKAFRWRGKPAKTHKGVQQSSKKAHKSMWQ